MFKDIQYALRMFVKRPGLMLVSVITLALGLGANTAIFSVTDKLLLRSLAVPEPQQLFLITSVSVSPHFVSNAFSYPVYSDYRAQQNVFSGLLAFSRTELELTTNNGAERVISEFVSGNYFDVLGIKAARGRTFLPEEDKTPGTQPVVVISDTFRRKRFGDTEDPVGKQITVNNFPLTIVGVAPENFSGMVLERPTELWVPVLMHPQLAQSKFIESRNDAILQLLGRLKPEVSQAQAEAGLDLLAQQIKAAHTPPGTITKGLPFSEQHIKFEPGGKGISILRKRFAAPLKLLMAVVGLVLLIACANIAALLLARGLVRRKEMAIRLAVGANSWRIVRQLMSESFLLAAIGGLAGLLVAPWLISLLVNTQSRLDVARTLLGQGLDHRVLIFATVATFAAGMIFGISPAWQSSKAELVPLLKDEGGVSSKRERRFSFRSLLVVSQLALAVIVLIAAGLCIRTMRNLLAIDPGYKAETLLVLPLELDEKKYDEARGRVTQQEIYTRLAALPGVTAVSNGLVIPLSGSRFVSSIFVLGRPATANEERAFDASVVGPRYHETMGIEMVAGRGFTDQDREGAPGVVIVNEALAQRLFPGENALGKRLSLKTNGAPLEIVGITRNVKHHDMTENPLPHFDLPALQRGYDSYTNIVARTKGPAEDLVPAARSIFQSVDPSLSVEDIAPMSAQIDNALAGTRLASTLISIFGLVALFLASIGLYGVMAWMVSNRTRELGIRIALGARSRDVLTLVIKQGLVLTLVGVGIGLLAALIAARFVDTQQLYGVTATDPFTFALIALSLTAVSLLACYVPARRATKVDPLKALKYE